MTEERSIPKMAATHATAAATVNQRAKSPTLAGLKEGQAALVSSGLQGGGISPATQVQQDSMETAVKRVVTALLLEIPKLSDLEQIAALIFPIY